MAEPKPAVAEAAIIQPVDPEVQKQHLIGFAHRIVADKANLVLVRSDHFRKPTQHRGPSYEKVVLERATKYVPSQSGLVYLALRDRYSEAGSPNIELVALPRSSRKAEDTPATGKPIFRFTNKEVAFFGDTDLLRLDIDSANNYLRAIDAGLESCADAFPRRLPSFAGSNERFEPGTVLDINEDDDYNLLKK